MRLDNSTIASEFVRLQSTGIRLFGGGYRFSKRNYSDENVISAAGTQRRFDEPPPWSTINIKDASAFLLGTCCAIPFHALGRLYLGEVLLTAAAFVLVLRWIMRPVKLNRLVTLFCGLVFVSGSGYLLSDLYRGTPMPDLVRGIGKWSILLTCTISLSWLGLKDFRRFCILVASWGLSFCIFPRILDRSLPEFVHMNPWKFIYAFPATLVCLYLANGRRWVTLGLLVCVTILSAILDTRSFALIAMATAACVVVCSMTRKQNVVLVAIAVLIFAAGGALIAKNAARNYDFTERQNTSTFWRMASFNMGVEAIKRSPIIGYGTWARELQLAELGDQMFEEYTGQKAFRFTWQADYVEAHSQILESWVQGGVLGVLFFLFLGYQTIMTLHYLLLRRRYGPECPFVVFLLIHGLWHLLFSPFGADHRLMIAFSITAICWLHRDAAATKE